MEKLDPSTIVRTCAHCGHSSPAFTASRCPSCQDDRFSPESYREMEEVLFPAIQQLSCGLNELTSMAFPAKKLEQLQPYFDILTPYTKDWEELAQWKEKLVHELAPYVIRADKQRNTIMLHLFILGILGLVPVFAYWMGAEINILGLLVLPFLGWLWIGIFAYLRGQRKGYDT